MRCTAHVEAFGAWHKFVGKLGNPSNNSSMRSVLWTSLYWVNVYLFTVLYSRTPACACSHFLNHLLLQFVCLVFWTFLSTPLSRWGFKLLVYVRREEVAFARIIWRTIYIHTRWIIALNHLSLQVVCGYVARYWNASRRLLYTVLNASTEYKKELLGKESLLVTCLINAVVCKCSWGTRLSQGTKNKYTRTIYMLNGIVILYLL